jgi:hypothetical protein
MQIADCRVQSAEVPRGIPIPLWWGGRELLHSAICTLHSWSVLPSGPRSFYFQYLQMRPTLWRAVAAFLDAHSTASGLVPIAGLEKTE